MRIGIDIDSYQEIVTTLTRNKTRSLLTGFGVFWGVFMLIILLGGGKLLKQTMFPGFSELPSNSMNIWANTTSKAYKGYPKGRRWQMTYQDMIRLKEQIPELEAVSPLLYNWGENEATYGDSKSKAYLNGTTVDFKKATNLKIRYGRYLNDMDIKQKRKVCVITQKVFQELFHGQDNPCGQKIMIDKVSYMVIGVCLESDQNNTESSGTIYVPLTLMQQVYNRGNFINQATLIGREGVVVSKLIPRVREVIGRAHSIDPTDEEGISIMNLELLFQIFNTIILGVNILIWMVGMGTLLTGAIGISNIMMVTVRERTTEIGIRRAIGATRRMILTQIITESAALTIVAGMSGILFGVIILQLAEMGTGSHIQIDFWTALLSAIIISIVGMLAGVTPALRAMKIKPVDAMRDE